MKTQELLSLRERLPEVKVDSKVNVETVLTSQVHPGRDTGCSYWASHKAASQIGQCGELRSKDLLSTLTAMTPGNTSRMTITGDG